MKTKKALLKSTQEKLGPNLQIYVFVRVGNLFDLLLQCPALTSFISPGGGVTYIYTGTGRAIFWVPFFEQEINFGVSFLVRL